MPMFQLLGLHGHREKTPETPKPKPPAQQTPSEPKPPASSPVELPQIFHKLFHPKGPNDMSFQTSIEHFYEKAVSETKAIGKFIAAHQAQIDQAAQFSVAIVSAVDPAVAPIATLMESAGEKILAKIIAASQISGAAAQGKGMQVTFDASFVSDVKTLIDGMEKLHPGSTKAPAGLPTSTVATAA